MYRTMDHAPIVLSESLKLNAILLEVNYNENGISECNTIVNRTKSVFSD